MKRNIAFFISLNNQDSKNYKLVRSHFVKLSNKLGFNVYETKFLNLDLLIIYEDELEIKNTNDEIRFPIGNLGKQHLNYDKILKKQLLRYKNDD